MGGIYIHIPFCKKACHYCDFHFSTNLKYIDQMVSAIQSEIIMKANRFDNEVVETIYFGGGTPSILSTSLVNKLLITLRENMLVTTNPEITLEANPEDLTPKKLNELRNIGINRLSIGVQTFDEERLKFLNRSHDATNVINSIINTKKAGFDNFSVDLIFAVPPADISIWKEDISRIINFEIPHISLYGLTIEKKTVFGNWVSNKKLIPVDEYFNAEQYTIAHELLTASEYLHYEVSNFAKKGFESSHNSAYWLQKKFLGFGPGAHSYDGLTRSFVIKNNAKYLKSMTNRIVPEDVEKLSRLDLLNEYIFTRLRTHFGINKTQLLNDFDINLEVVKENELNEFRALKLIEEEGNLLKLTFKGYMLADEIALKLFFED